MFIERKNYCASMEGMIIFPVVGTEIMPNLYDNILPIAVFYDIAGECLYGLAFTDEKHTIAAMTLGPHNADDV